MLQIKFLNNLKILFFNGTYNSFLVKYILSFTYFFENTHLDDLFSILSFFMNYFLNRTISLIIINTFYQFSINFFIELII